MVLLPADDLASAMTIGSVMNAVDCQLPYLFASGACVDSKGKDIVQGAILIICFVAHSLIAQFSL